MFLVKFTILAFFSAITLTPLDQFEQNFKPYKMTTRNRIKKRRNQQLLGYV